MKWPMLVILASTVFNAQASAFEATITRVAPGKAVPVTAVGRNELAPPPGVETAPPRVRASYTPEIGGRPVGRNGASNIPTPMPRPSIALGCPIVFKD